MTSSWGDHECKILIYRFIIFGQLGSINMVSTLRFFFGCHKHHPSCIPDFGWLLGSQQKMDMGHKKKHGLDSLSFGICVWDSTKNNMPRDRPIPFHTGKSNQNHSCIFCLLFCWETATSKRKCYRFHEQTGHLHAIVAEFRGLCLCFAKHLHVRHWCWQGLKFWNQIGKA